MIRKFWHLANTVFIVMGEIYLTEVGVRLKCALWALGRVQVSAFQFIDWTLRRKMVSLHYCAASRFDSWPACWWAGVSSELHVLVRAGGPAGMWVLGRQEVNGACLFF